MKHENSLCFVLLHFAGFIGHVTAKCSRESVCNLNMCLVLLAPFRFVLLASLLDWNASTAPVCQRSIDAVLVEQHNVSCASYLPARKSNITKYRTRHKEEWHCDLTSPIHTAIATSRDTPTSPRPYSLMPYSTMPDPPLFTLQCGSYIAEFLN